jgi:hypothetical protein
MVHLEEVGQVVLEVFFVMREALVMVALQVEALVQGILEQIF